MPDLVRTFRAAHPGVGFQLTQVRDELHSAALDGGQADLEIGTRRPTRPCMRGGSPLSRCTWPCRAIISSPVSSAFSWRKYPGNLIVSLRPASALRQLTDDLCEQAGFCPAVVFEGDDLSTVRGFVAAGLGVAIVPAPRAGSPESATGPVLYSKILDTGAVREICLRWPAERRLLPAAELFRQHVITSATTGRVPVLSNKGG